METRFNLLDKVHFMNDNRLYRGRILAMGWLEKERVIEVIVQEEKTKEEVKAYMHELHAELDELIYELQTRYLDFYSNVEKEEKHG